MRKWNPIRRLATMALLLALFVSAAGTALAGEPGSYAAALEQAAAEGKLVIVDFYTDW
jgi:hypothetical protein